MLGILLASTSTLEVQVKSLTEPWQDQVLLDLWQHLAADLSAVHGVSTDRDFLTVSERTEKEGSSFLMITLPSFASDLERALELGRVDSNLFAGFRRSGGLPVFLSGFLRRIFSGGVLKDDACPDSVFAVRQLCCFAKKIEVDPTPRRVRKALDNFVLCESDLKRKDGEWIPDDLREFSRISAMLFGDVFDEVNTLVETFQLRPKHGPGATADFLKGNQKWNLPEWTERMESVFPYVEYGVPNYRHFDPEGVITLPPAQERPVRVTAVPKTRKTPRLIAIEPTCMQYMQQAFLRAFASRLDGSRATPSSPSFVGLRDQLPNQELARKGSIDGSLATLDLSEASDRVSNQLVLELFRPWPGLSEGIQACRSRTAELGDGRVLRLSKFASMGSAVCFPIEAMVFTTIIFLGIQDAEHRRLRQRDLVRFRGQVRVFGDDIIVPVRYADFVIRRLEAFGLKVNSAKSFWNGSFRESCGGDFFKGVWVTPIRFKKLPPMTKQDVSELQNWVEVSNNLHAAGLWKAARFTADIVERVLGKLPVTASETDALTLKSFVSGFKASKVGWDEELHLPLVRAWVVHAESPVNEIDGVPALHKALSGDWSDPLFRGHLVRSGRPVSARVKKRMVPA